MLSGSIQPGKEIELPNLQLTRKVKSMQMFKTAVTSAKQGDRVGICVTNLDPKLIERGIAVAPGSVPLIRNVICLVKKVRFFKLNCKSGSKVHISVGHTTLVASAVFFGEKELREKNSSIDSHGNDSSAAGPSLSHRSTTFPSVSFDCNQEFLYQEQLIGPESPLTTCFGDEPLQYALLRFQQPVFCPLGSLLIASRLDTEDGNREKQGEVYSYSSFFAMRCLVRKYMCLLSSVLIYMYHRNSR